MTHPNNSYITGTVVAIDRKQQGLYHYTIVYRTYIKKPGEKKGEHGTDIKILASDVIWPISMEKEYCFHYHKGLLDIFKVESIG